MGRGAVPSPAAARCAASRSSCHQPPSSRAGEEQGAFEKPCVCLGGVSGSAWGGFWPGLPELGCSQHCVGTRRASRLKTLQSPCCICLGLFISSKWLGNAAPRRARSVGHCSCLMSEKPQGWRRGAVQGLRLCRGSRATSRPSPDPWIRDPDSIQERGHRVLALFSTDEELPCRPAFGWDSVNLSIKS